MPVMGAESTQPETRTSPIRKAEYGEVPITAIARSCRRFLQGPSAWLTRVAPEPGTRPKLGSWKSEHKHADDMARLTAAEISKLLRELALRLELEGGNPYRARAYSRAAD